MNDMTLTDFLLARIAEDEEMADEPVVFDSEGWARLADRVLAECEAKRRIVDLAEVAEDEGAEYVYRAALKALALPYADHPDYRQEWRP